MEAVIESDQELMFCMEQSLPHYILTPFVSLLPNCP